uniref:Bifunctional inhibitor/plant lipid transfer protein/seed storage helical domain-containing protein n=1 Tax=Zea mays TaxID=4577 RepID=A0A804ULV3_MAIZE
MNTTKVMLRVLVFSLVFTMLSTHQALGNKENCDKDKDFIKRQCESITLEEQLTISVMKVVDVAKECGNPVPPGNKCGTWTVPPQLLARVHP